MGEIYLDNVQANLISSFFNSILIPFASLAFESKILKAS